MRILFASIVSVLSVTACQTPEPVIQKVPVPYAVEIRPELPEVRDFDRDFPMDEILFDIPRDMAANPVLMNTPECAARTADILPADDPCLIYPPDPFSNLYIGLDQENADKLRLNLKKLQEKERLRDEQDAQTNARREEWHKENEKAMQDLGNE